MAAGSGKRERLQCWRGWTETGLAGVQSSASCRLMLGDPQNIKKREEKSWKTPSCCLFASAGGFPEIFP